MGVLKKDDILITYGNRRKPEYLQDFIDKYPLHFSSDEQTPVIIENENSKEEKKGSDMENHPEP